jgi:hypothetical protein
MDSNDLRELAELIGDTGPHYVAVVHAQKSGQTGSDNHIAAGTPAGFVDLGPQWLTTPEGTRWLTCELARRGCTIVTRTADTPRGLSHIAEITCRGVTRAMQADDLGEAMATAALAVLRAGRGGK